MTDVEEFTEYGWLVKYGDGSRGWLTPLGADRDRALAQFRMLEADMPKGDDTMRLVFASSRVTRTPWAEEATTSASGRNQDETGPRRQ